MDATDLETRETGLSSFTVYRSRDGGTAAAYTTPTVNETDATNMPGVYELLLDEDMTIGSGNDSEEVCLHITHASMAPVTRTFELYRRTVTSGNTLGVASDGDISGNLDGTVATVTTLTGHTAQTGDSYARLGAPAGASIAADLVTIDTVVDGIQTDLDNGTDGLGAIKTAVDAVPSAGTIADSVWDELQSAHVTVGSFGEIATEIADILADTNELQTDDIPGLIAALNDVAATDIVSGGAITTSGGAVSNVTLVATTTTNTDMRGTDSAYTGTPPTAAAIADQVWDEDATAHQTTGTFGQAIGDPVANTKTLYAALITDAAGASVTADVASIQTDTTAIVADTNELQGDWANGGRLDLILDELTTNLDAVETDTQDLQTQIGTAGAGLTAIPWNASWDAEVQSEVNDGLTAFWTSPATLVDLIWDEEVTVGHTTADSAGKKLNDASSAGDPWATALPGAYGAGTAGKIIGDNIDAPISTVDTVVDGIQTDLSNGTDGLGAIKTAVDAIPTSNPTAAAIADQVWDEAQSAHTTLGSFGEIATEIASILADTNELQTDDVPGLIAALNDVAATDIVSAGAITTLAGAVVNVDLVDTCTTNTDMRGTDSAYTGTPPTAAAIADQVWDEAQVDHATAGTFGEVATEVAAILVDTGTTLPGLIGTPVADVATDIAGIQTDTTAIVADTNELQTDDVPGLIAALNDLSAAEVNAEVVDALNVDTYAEPSQGAPAATASIAAKINYLYKAWRNKSTQTATAYSLYDDAGSTVDQKATVSDDGTTLTSGEIGTGP